MTWFSPLPSCRQWDFHVVNGSEKEIAHQKILHQRIHGDTILGTYGFIRNCYLRKGLTNLCCQPHSDVHFLLNQDVQLLICSSNITLHA